MHQPHIRLNPRRLDPRTVDPTRGRVWADASVVAVCVLDVLREFASIYAPAVVGVVFVLYYCIEIDHKGDAS